MVPIRDSSMCSKVPFFTFCFQHFVKKNRSVVSSGTSCKILITPVQKSPDHFHMVSLRVHLTSSTQWGPFKQLKFTTCIHLPLDQGVAVPYINSLQDLQFQRNRAPAQNLGIRYHIIPGKSCGVFMEKVSFRPAIL